MENELKILILSYFFEPDISAGSFKNTALVKALKCKMPKQSTIEVISTLPSRYSSFSRDAPSYEKKQGIIIHRILVPPHNNNMLTQVCAFLIYVYHVLKLVRGKNYDLIYASSSRLMTGVLASHISKRKKTPLYIDIRDIFVDTINNIFPVYLRVILKPILSMLEKIMIRRAEKVNLVSYGFKHYFHERYPEKSFSFFPNGIDKEFTFFGAKQKTSAEKDVLQVLYAGNLGVGQGLHNIIPQLAKKFEGRLEFQIIGDGNQKNQLESFLRNNDVKNVQLLAPVTREKLKQIYLSSDILFLHLNNYEAFLKVLPSKIFEYAASGKPIWAGVSGYAAEFLHDEVPNSAIFKPCNVEQAIKSFQDLKIQTSNRIAFTKKYSREKIMHKMATDIIKIIKK